MGDKETKSTMREFTANDQEDYYFGITSIIVNGKNAYELKGKFLDDLHKNAFSGTHGEDTTEHIEYFLKIVDPIDLPNDGYEIVDHDQEEREYENRHEDKKRCELLDDHELLVCNIRRLKMIKYSFGDGEEYVVVKENEYDDLTSTSKDACRAYQEIFRMV
nr:hypothetical protein [Tanacetum cinerariifolium]